MKIAVTGGNGDLGQSLIPYLMEEGHQVISIDRFIPPLTNPPPAHAPTYLKADVTNFGELIACLNGCEAIIHLAAHRSPLSNPHPVVYNENSAGSYNVLFAAATLGIKRVCLASSVNAIGGVFSRSPQYDYFPVDEQHLPYAEDPYSLSKWVLEQQADSFARRYEWMSIASLRFHWLIDSRARVIELTAAIGETAVRHLWAYTLLSEANRACLLSLTAPFSGHEAFYIVAPLTASDTPSQTLTQQHYPSVPLRQEITGHTGFFDCRKAEQLLGWTHQED
ncbi:MAG: NAD(P)-dependent oxidoreductase [Ardenticatenaceae bacterium]|nr:NAD(P)-dependent oxidoreductase [Ardenticatenaceae bacterium]